MGVDLSPELASLRAFVYRTFANEGRPPSAAEAARILHRSTDSVRFGFEALHERHLLVLSHDRDVIRMAHPFSSAPMGFVVRDGDARWWGGCTWDSLGIAAALGRPLTIETVCPECLRELRFRAGPGLPPDVDLAVRVPLPAAQWWADIVWTCTRIRSFCSTDHAEAFAAARSEALGELVPLETMWRLSIPWYGDRLSPDYAPRTAATSQAILSEVGLTGHFWRLP